MAFSEDVVVVVVVVAAAVDVVERLKCRL